MGSHRNRRGVLFHRHPEIDEYSRVFHEIRVFYIRIMDVPGQKPLKNPRHEKFCRQYSRHGNGTRAVISAGYNAKSWLEDKSNSAAVQSCMLLRNPNIIQRIQYLRERIAIKDDLTELKLRRELERISFFDVRKLYDENGHLRPIHELDADTAAAVSEVEVEKLFDCDDRGKKVHAGYTVKVKTNKKVDAIDKLMRYYGMVDQPNDAINTITVNDHRQVNFYLPENPRHAKAHTDESSSTAPSGAQPITTDATHSRSKSNGNGTLRQYAVGVYSPASLHESRRYSLLWRRSWRRKAFMHKYPHTNTQWVGKDWRFISWRFNI